MYINLTDREIIVLIREIVWANELGQLLNINRLGDLVYELRNNIEKRQEATPPAQIIKREDSPF